MQNTLIIIGIFIGVIITLYLLARARMKNIPLVADNDKILNVMKSEEQNA